LDNNLIDNKADLIKLMRKRPNQKVVIELLRKGEIRQITLTLGEWSLAEPVEFKFPRQFLKNVKKYLKAIEPHWQKRVAKYQAEIERLKKEIKELREELKELRKKLAENRKEK